MRLVEALVDQGDDGQLADGVPALEIGQDRPFLHRGRILVQGLGESANEIVIGCRHGSLVTDQRAGDTAAPHTGSVSNQ